MEITPSKQQKDAIEAGDGPVLIIAGAGTGKTFTITQRIVHLINKKDVHPESILALTFTEKAAFEMVERVDKHLSLSLPQVPISTFHAFCDNVLREDGLSIGISPDFQLMTATDEVFFLRKQLNKLDLDELRPVGNQTKYISGIVKHLSRLQDEDISPEKYENFIKETNTIEDDYIERYKELSYLYKNFQKLKFENNRLSFGDLIHYTLELFRTKPNIKSKWQEKYQYFLIDEFQDTNFSQYELVKLMADYSSSPNIMVVADDDQSIYKFRGAAVSNVLAFTNDFPETKRIVLTENRRSVQEILDSSYRLIQNNNPDRLEVKEGISKKLTEEGTNLVEYPSPVEHRSYLSASDEGEGIALEIKDLSSRKDIVEKSKDQLGLTFTPAVNYSEIAILVRANSHSEEVIDALERHKIPYQFHGAKRLFNEEVVKNLINFLRVVADYNEDISMNGLLTMDLWKLGERDLIEINMSAKKEELSIFEYLENNNNVESLNKLIEIIKKSWNMYKNKKKIWDILYMFIQESGYLSELTESEVTREGVVYDITDEIEKENKLRSLSRIFEFIKAYEKNNPTDRIQEFIEYVDMTLESGESPIVEDVDDIERNAVNIITVHSSKGLEFPVVFVPSLARGRFPSRKKSDLLEVPEELIQETLPTGDEHEEEERRLFYVALTRAKYKAYLSSAVKYGEGKRRSKVSPFIVEIFGEDDVLQNIESPAQFDIKFPEVKADEADKGYKRINTTSKLSYSQIQTYQSCPRKYWYSYVLKVPRKPSGAITYGNIIHKTLEEFYNKFLESKESTLEELSQIFEDNWTEEGFESKRQQMAFKSRGLKSLRNFYKELFNEQDKPLHLEASFSIGVGDIKLVGKIDRIDEAGNESVEIIDYKTGENKNKLKISADQIRQLAIYSIAAEQVFKVNADKLSFLFIDLGEKVTPKKSRIDKMKEKVITEIGEVAEKINKREFGATPGYPCKYCDYNKICKYAKL